MLNVKYAASVEKEDHNKETLLDLIDRRGVL